MTSCGTTAQTWTARIRYDGDESAWGEGLVFASADAAIDAALSRLGLTRGDIARTVDGGTRAIIAEYFVTEIIAVPIDPARSPLKPHDEP